MSFSPYRYIRNNNEIKKCNKKKFDKIEAMLLIANSNKQTQKNFNRKEIRLYFCDECRCYHVTSKK